MKQSSKTKNELPAEKSPQKKKNQKPERPEASIKSADEDLHEVESPYKTLFNRATEGILIAESKTKRFKYANPALCRMFGYLEEEMLQLGVHDIHPEESLKEVLAEFDAMKRGKKTWALNIPCLRKDGSIFYVNISMASVFLEGVKCNAGFFTDITMLREADRLQQESKARLEEAQRIAKIGSWEHDLLTNRIFWSDQMFRIFEFDRERVDLSFELLLAAIHPEDREKFNAGIKKTLANPKNAQLSYRLLMSDGRIKYINVQYVVHQDPKGQPLRLVGTSQDITDLKKAEDALGESEAKFRNLFESAGDSIFLLDNDVFIDCNPKALEMFGCTREQIIGQPPSRFSPEIQPDGKSSKEQAIANNRAVLKGQPQYFEWKHRRYDGTFFDAAISLTAFLDKGKPYILAICRDITENKRVLEALHESEQKIRESHALLRIAGEKAKLGGWSINLQENRITCSDEVLAIHEMPVGYSPLLEEGISFYAPEWQAKITEVFTDCAQKGIPYDEEMQIITAGGKRVWVRTIGEAVKDDTGKIIKVHGAFQDITDRKQTEEALRESEEKYKQLFENAPAGIFRVDFKSGKFIDANDVFCDYAGCSQDEISFLGPFDLLTESSKKLFMERVGKMSRGINVPPTVELEILNKKGRRLNVQLNVKNICDSEGHVIGADVVAHDITLQKQIEDELRASESNFRNSLNDSPLGMRISTIEGETIYANRAILDIYGYNSIEELKKKTIKERYTPESYAAWQMRKEKRIQGEFGPSEYEISIVRKNGEIRHLQAFRKEIFWDGAVRFQVYYNDITERKRAEEEKRKLEERLNRVEKMEALGQLAGGVAHDLNNVLGVLAGYSELLLMEIPEGQRARSHAEKIMQSTEKGAAIVQDLLTLARRGVTASEVIDLNDVVSGFLKSPVFDNIQGSHPRVNFKVVCNEALLKIKGSPIHLEKTLMNLVLNAAESISGEGDVTIRTENRYLEKPIVGYDEVKEGDYVVLTLSDTGTGIPAENREKIFEPFYTKKPMGRSGTGLGLAIVWGTVKDHKGYIDVQTEIGRGTTFTLYFPVTREEMTSPQQKKCMEEYMGRGETVLVVDDIAGQREVASALIQKLGYRVHALSSGEEALEYLRQNQADILVLDMIMVPGIDGLETYQRALEINPKQKAVIVSGFSETDRVKDAQKMGAGAYVRKPYVMETLGMAIRNELRR